MHLHHDVTLVKLLLNRDSFNTVISLRPPRRPTPPFALTEAAQVTSGVTTGRAVCRTNLSLAAATGRNTAFLTFSWRDHLVRFKQ